MPFISWTCCKSVLGVASEPLPLRRPPYGDFPDKDEKVFFRGGRVLHVVLVEPEIPPNTGNIARTCAATDTALHLVEPLGFSVEDRYLRRAGVDYWHLVDVRIHQNWDDLVMALEGAGSFHFFTSHGGIRYCDAQYGPDDVLVFGRESTGLPEHILEPHRERWRVIPMADGVRSLNLSNAVAIAVYEAQRQMGFPLQLPV